MLALLPRHLPALPLLLDDLGAPAPSRLAAALGVSRRTVERWMAAQHAPRLVGLALWPLTRWARSEAECKAHNDAQLQAAQVRALQLENEALRRALARVATQASPGAANGPLWPEYRPREPEQIDSRREREPAGRGGDGVERVGGVALRASAVVVNLLDHAHQRRGHDAGRH